MHRTEGPDYATVGGKRRYKDTHPATIISKDQANALQEEIAGAVELSGQTLRTTGALDEAGAWGQLSEAIKRLPWVQSVETTVTLVTGVATALAPTLAQNFIRIERSGGITVPGLDVVLPNNVAYLGRIITIRNSASAVISIKDRRGYISLMANLAVEQFYCFTDDAGAHYDWAPMSGEYSGIFSATIDLSDVAASLAARDFYYRKKGYHVHLFFPGFDFSETGAVNAGNLVTVNLPTWLHAGNYQYAPYCLYPSAPPDTLGVALIGSAKLILRDVVNGNIGVPGQVISYFSNNELTGP